jgi:protein phosphatase
MTSPPAPATLAGPGWRPRPGNAQWLGARQEQEDAFGFAGFDARGQAGPDGVLAVVADGMGGLSQGRAASQGAVSGFLAAWAAQPPDLAISERLLGAIAAANQAVHDLARATAGEGEVGTTLVAAAIHQGHLFWISAGDSRLYLYRAADGSLTPCNEEHNLALQLWREAPADGPTPDWIEDHPQRDALISFLGLAEIPEIDRNVRPLALEAGDRLLLCSDGVDGVLSPDELREGLDADPQTAAGGLTARLRALDLPFQDNATVAILACEGLEAPTRASPAAPSSGRVRRRLGLWTGALVLMMVGLGFWLGWGRWWATAPLAVEAIDPRTLDLAQTADAEQGDGSAENVPPAARPGEADAPASADAAAGAAGARMPPEAVGE